MTWVFITIVIIAIAVGLGQEWAHDLIMWAFRRGKKGSYSLLQRGVQIVFALIAVVVGAGVIIAFLRW